MSAAQDRTSQGRIANFRRMLWLTSPTMTAARLPAAWLIATDARPADLAERSALRRGLAREVLARQFGLPVARVIIEHDPRGRPLLGIPGMAARHISLATRAGQVAIALAERPVGVDVEVVSVQAEPPVAVLHPAEQAFLASLREVERATAFAKIWSAKEAYVKALGLGFLRPPESFAVTLQGDGGISVTDPQRDGRIHGHVSTMKNGGQDILAAAIVMLL
jgi:4'-phosphopantetheinyl transferase